MIKQLLNLPKLKIEKIELIDNVLHVFAEVKSKRSKCPCCGKYSNKIHSFYNRTLKDIPLWQTSSMIILKTRKFKCKNPICKRKVFSEQTPYALPYSRRTVRAYDILDSLSIELTGKLGCKLSKKLLIPVSTSTITRIAHNQPLPDIEQPKILGIDDWAYRKGISDGTVLVDMETSRPIDILSSREGKDLKEWLSKYPDVKIVTRDRASSYSSAINDVCPDTMQIADRFHLLMNLSDALDKYFKSISPKIRSVIKAKSNELINDENANTENKQNNMPEPIESETDQRMIRFNKVKELQAKGVSGRKIAKDIGICRNTVRSYFSQKTLLPKQHPKSTNIDQFTNHIVSMLSIPGYKVKDIINKITELGFNGGTTQAYSNINAIKEKFKIQSHDYSQIYAVKIPYIKPLTTRKLAKFIDLELNEIIDLDERKYMETLFDNLSELHIIRKLVQIFKTMFRRRKGNIRRWIKFIQQSKHKLKGLRTFANGLLYDIKAVENGIHMEWSNGPVEGHVNRIKNIKRKMYGRASFDLLRKKVILSQTG